MVLTALVQVYCSSVFWYFKNIFYFLFLNKNYLLGYRKRNNSHLLVDLKKNPDIHIGHWLQEILFLISQYNYIV